MRETPLLLGHRGARGSASVSENTVAAFDLALEHGCDGFEFDLRLTADGSAVVCHDARFAGIAVARTAAARVRRLPRFEDVLARYSERGFLDIELKVPGLAESVIAAIGERPPKRGYVLSSFLPEVLIELRNSDHSLPLGFIYDRKKQRQRWRELPVDYVIPHHSMVTRELTDQVHDAGKKLFVWTVNGKASMLRFAGWTVDGIISDKTELLVSTFKGGSRQSQE
jgi:glycerophosphoryl diester phosphodiesterase